MIGKCFSVLCIISFAFACITSNMKELSDGIIQGAAKSVQLVISLVGIMTLWGGIMEVLKASGVISKLARLLTPVLRFIFPRSFKDKKATEEITACISANLLGLSNATTPLALNAIEKMNKGRKSDKATNDMIMLAVLGCASFNLVPTTIIALRAMVGASITYEIIVPVWICSGVCSLLGVILCRLIGKFSGDY